MDDTTPTPAGRAAEARTAEPAAAELRRTVRRLRWGRPAVLARVGLIVAVCLFVGAFAARAWAKYDRFDLYGFDTGIFDQIVWLMSRGDPSPFSTIRNLPALGDHTSYLLLLVAPLYRVWADPRLLILLQTVFLALPAVAVYRIATRRLRNELVALALAVAYLAQPAMQWAATYEFHPETIAAGLLGLAVLASEEQRPRAMALWLGLAMLAKEDVSLVVAGFGATLMLTGRVRWGRRVAAAGLAYFALATFVLIPQVLGGPVQYLESRYGIRGGGPVDLVRGVPVVLGNVVDVLSSERGLLYLVLIFLPLAGLPLLAWRWLLPVLPPLLLNLASVSPFQQEIRYHYLATSVPFLGVAAVMGAERLARLQRPLLFRATAALVVASLFLCYAHAPAPGKTRQGNFPPETAQNEARRAALALVGPDEVVSASREFVPRVTHRQVVYQFPDPWFSPAWEAPAQNTPPTRAQQEGVDVVIVSTRWIRPSERHVLDRFLADPATWRVVFDRDGVYVLRRNEPPPPS